MHENRFILYNNIGVKADLSLGTLSKNTSALSTYPSEELNHSLYKKCENVTKIIDNGKMIYGSK